MAVDWILNLPCRPKQILGEGDFAEGTLALLEGLKAGDRAAMIEKLAREHGQSPEGQVVMIQVARPDGISEEQEVRYEDLAAQAQRLDPLAPDCDGCAANVRGRPFGCMGLVKYPIAASVERWLAELLQPSSNVGGKLFLAAIRDFNYTGEPIRGFRANGLFELPNAIKKKLKGGLFSSEVASTDQLFQAILCINEPLDPGHCLGILLWLGCLRLDGAVIETPQQASAIARLASVDARQERTSIVTGADRRAKETARFEMLLRALYGAWVLDVSLWVSA